MTCIDHRDISGSAPIMRKMKNAVVTYEGIDSLQVNEAVGIFHFARYDPMKGKDQVD